GRLGCNSHVPRLSRSLLSVRQFVVGSPMPITVQCPTCSARVTAPDKLAGKTVRCPKCHEPFTLPVPDAGFEGIDDAEPEVAKPAGADQGFEVVDEVGTDRVSNRKRHRTAGSGSDRPVRSRDDRDDEGDDRSRFRNGRKGRTATLVTLAALGVCVVLAAGA